MATRRHKHRTRSNASIVNNSDPANWTTTQLKQALKDIGINISSDLDHSVLKMLHLVNINRASARDASLSSPSEMVTLNTDSTVSPPTVSTQLQGSVDNGQINMDNNINMNLSTPATQSCDAVYPQISRMNKSGGNTIAHLAGTSTLPTSAQPDMGAMFVNTMQMLNNTLQQFNSNNISNQFQPTYNLQSAMASSSMRFPNSLNINNHYATSSSSANTVPLYSVSSHNQSFGVPASAVSDVDLISPDIRQNIISVADIDVKTHECKNALSARRDPDTVNALLTDELAQGFVYGPYDIPHFKNYRVSPIGIATHKYSFKKRLIIDLSSPHNNVEHSSVNDLIDKDLCSLTYIKLDDAIQVIQDYGPYSICCKFDVSDAFKQLAIKTSQWHLFCFKWENKYYHYVRLPFGCRSSPRLFDFLSSTICWIAKTNYKIDVIFHLLDDFFTIDRPSHCGERTMALLSLIFNKPNIPLSSKKTVVPTYELEYLGVILDTVNMQARLPRDKIMRITSFIAMILDKKSCTRKELEQLLGHLNFATRVILPGRSFVSYSYNIMSSVKESFHYVHLTKECKSDLRMWLYFLTNWNGINLFYDNAITPASNISLYTDASSTVGFGGIYQNKWFCNLWPEDLPTVSDYKASMAFIELYPIVVACVLWGGQWTGKKILFHCDNEATVQIIKNGRSKEPFIMTLMRRLTVCAAVNNFAIYSEHLPGVDNCIADSLSRLQMERFRSLAPHADKVATPCPPLKEILWSVP